MNTHQTKAEPIADGFTAQMASGQDEAAVLDKLRVLLVGQDATPRQCWTLVMDGKGIRRSFKFKGFKRTWEFMQAVAEKCKEVDHHPDWFNSYNRTVICWTTHRPAGLSIKDVEMAAWCDEQARVHGEVDKDETQSTMVFGHHI